MPWPNDTAFVLQEDLQRWLKEAGTTQWQTVYQSDHGGDRKPVIFCALLTEAVLSEALSDEEWDFRIGTGTPCFIQESSSEVTYDATGGYEGARPLVLVRRFSAGWPAYQEICEEFRLLHNLAEDRNRGVLLDFDESGYEIDVVRFSKDKAEIRLDYLKRFLAATGLWLAVYIDSVRYSPTPFEDFGFGTKLHVLHVSNEMQRYVVNISESELRHVGRTLSRLYGKVLIAPAPRETSGIWPFERKADAFVEFTIGLQKDGTLRAHTCDPDALADFFGKNKAAPNYLTPVFFGRDVLSKYYTDASRYEVSDGSVACHGYWHIQIDNNHPTHVAAYLGDLGRDLPASERLHWKQYNVLPEGTVSEVDYARSFLAKPTEPTAPDLVFRREYARLQAEWYKAHGWHVMLPPTGDDEYLLRTIRIPTTRSQGEFDEQVLILTKLLVDSLNEAEILRQVGAGPKDEKGISKFCRFVEHIALPNAELHVQFLRNLQSLRSAGSGHRKGQQYKKALSQFGPSETSTPEIVRTMLVSGTNLVRALRAVSSSAQSTA